MTDPHQMPETPWWSQPGTTAVLPTPAPPAEAPPAPPKARKPRGSAGLLALALVVGGAAGGGVAEYFHKDSAATLTSSTPLAGGTVTNGSKTLSGTPESAAATIGPSVVTIEVTGYESSAFGQQQVADTGSGVIIRDSGYILTNNHVVAAAVGNGGTVNVTLADGKSVAAKIVGTDPTTDLAVIKIDGQSGLKAATFASAETLRVGQAVIAVGAPLGLSNTVTEGIVSTLHRAVRTGVDEQAVIDAVQTDAAINPGNSGGALADLAGRLVGINSAIATVGGSSSGSQSGNIGVGFSIPSDTARKVADQLIATGQATHSQIGVSVPSNDSDSSTPGDGARITDVKAGGPADKGGLQAGDVVTKVNSRLVTSGTDLIAAIRSYDPGTTLTLTLTRGGATKTVKVTLGTSSSS